MLSKNYREELYCSTGSLRASLTSLAGLRSAGAFLQGGELVRERGEDKLAILQAQTVATEAALYAKQQPAMPPSAGLDFATIVNPGPAHPGLNSHSGRGRWGESGAGDIFLS